MNKLWPDIPYVVTGHCVYGSSHSKFLPIFVHYLFLSCFYTSYLSIFIKNAKLEPITLHISKDIIKRLEFCLNAIGP